MQRSSEPVQRIGIQATTPESDTSVDADSATARFQGIIDRIEATGVNPFAARQSASEQYPELAAQANRERERRQRDEEFRKWLETDMWPGKTGRFSTCRLETFALHGSQEERDAQRRIVAALHELKLGEVFRAGQNILFIGPVGTGKDHLMHALAWRCLVPLSGSVSFQNGSALRRELRAATLDGGDANTINYLIEASLLCLSDPVPAGDTELTDYQVDCLYQIADARWRARRPLWATINLPVKDTRETAERILSAPVWDRLKDGALIVRCNWRSYRKHAEVIE